MQKSIPSERRLSVRPPLQEQRASFLLVIAEADAERDCRDIADGSSR